MHPTITDTFRATLPFTPEQVDYLELLARALCGTLADEDVERLAWTDVVTHLAEDVDRLGGVLTLRDEPTSQVVAVGTLLVTELHTADAQVDFDDFSLVRDTESGEARVEGASCKYGTLESLLSTVLARFGLDYAMVIPFATMGRDETGEEVYGGGVMAATPLGASYVDSEVAGHIGCLLAQAASEDSADRAAARLAIQMLLVGVCGEGVERRLGALQAELLELAREGYRAD